MPSKDKVQTGGGQYGSHLWCGLDDRLPVLEDDLDLRESPDEFDRGASDTSADIDDRGLLAVFLPIVVVDEGAVEEALGSNHGLVGAVAGELGLGGLEPLPDGHVVLELERAFLVAAELDAFDDVRSGLVCVIGPEGNGQVLACPCMGK